MLSCSLSYSTSSSEERACLSLLTLLTDLISQSFDYFRWCSLNSSFMVPVEGNCLNTVLLRSCQLCCCLACGILGSTCHCTFLEKNQGEYSQSTYTKSITKKDHQYRMMLVCLPHTNHSNCCYRTNIRAHYLS